MDDKEIVLMRGEHDKQTLVCFIIFHLKYTTGACTVNQLYLAAIKFGGVLKKFKNSRGQGEIF